MSPIRIPIIPTESRIVKIDDSNRLDFKALSIFVTLGFFLDQDTHWKNKKVLRACHDYEIGNNDSVVEAGQWFNWYHEPRERPFDQVVDEFASIFESGIDENMGDRKIILPISGGIDSRTQAVAHFRLRHSVQSYSYQFENGYNETAIAREIAARCNFGFDKFLITRGYLWSKIDMLAKLNGCFSEFTSPRQLAMADKLSSSGDIFSLGHWGDVLFDNLSLPSDLSNDERLEFLVKLLVKPGGLELGKRLWDMWGLDGSFASYLRNRLCHLLTEIKIDDPNAQIRAFKSLYWAPRWTSVNLGIFRKYNPVYLPYYDDPMCKFICEVPERYLTGRKIQIAYIKRYFPELAGVIWQDVRPYNLNNYQNKQILKTIAYKSFSKASRIIQGLFGYSYVQRNWELQFLGKANKEKLFNHLMQDDVDWLPSSIRKIYFDNFYANPEPKTFHALSMLLTLSKFNHHFCDHGAH